MDSHPSLLGQEGYGTQGSEPDASRNWINASATPGWDDPSLEWEAYPIDSTDDLGQHLCP